MIQSKLSRSIKYGSECLKISYRQSSSEPAKTCLYDFHVSRGGKMVDFAGYSMPVQYSSLGISASHLHTRSHCSIFDVSHMLQTRVWGRHRREFIESLTVLDMKRLRPNSGALTVFTTNQGGIIDDLIVTDAGDHLYVVSNAGCREKDVPLLTGRAEEMSSAGQDVAVQFLSDRGLVALQGPCSVSCLQPLTQLDLARLTFMSSAECLVAGIPCRLTRCGYTGEDGLEISVPSTEAATLVEALLQSDGQPALAGLGARDSLRLEAGLCLYGSDMDEDTSPVEAGLAWLISKERRARGGYPGAETISTQLREGVKRRRVGLVSRGPPARGGADILDLQGTKVGRVTSGCPSPSLGGGTNVAMGYVETEHSKLGTPLLLSVRNKHIETSVTKMPFVPSNYYNIK